MSANDPFSILNRDPNRGKVEVKQKVTVQRLRAGQLPDWALQEQDPEQTELRKHHLVNPSGALKYKGMTADASGIIIDTSMGQKNILENVPQEIASFQQETVKTEQVGGDDRRAKIRQKMLELEKLQQQAKTEQVEEEDDDEGLFGEEEEMPVIVDTDKALQNLQVDSDQDSSEQFQNDNDHQDEEQPEQTNITLLKPVYVSKQDRETLEGERKKQEQEEQEDRDFLHKQREEKRQYTKQLVAETILKDTQTQDKVAQNGYDSDENLPDFANDDDEDRQYLNSQQAYEDWKIRELRRLKRERDERNEREREAKEIERRRLMTDAEREEENRRLGSDHTNKKQKVALNFMQTWYHKGAFFQDELDPKLHRDYNMPVGDDKMDKSILPAVLQKRRGQLGKKGNSKWTHLTAEDTTNFDPAHRVPDNIAFKTQLRQGGYKAMNQLERPSIRKRMH